MVSEISIQIPGFFSTFIAENSRSSIFFLHFPKSVLFLIKILMINKMKTFCFTFLLVISLCYRAFADEGMTQDIIGTVVDKVTGQPLIGATVVVPGSDPLIGTITNENGFFRLKEVPLGRRSVEVSYVGYNKCILPNLLLISGKEMVVTVKLEEKAFDIQSITVKPNQKKEGTINDNAIVSARTFSVEETERFAGSLGDPARMVANYAGVMTQNDSRNDIIIRGNSPIGVLWRLEGIEIPNPNHFGALGTTGGPVSMINNNLLANSDFLTGAFPAEYGNAVAGAFDLKLRSGNNQKTEYTGQIGFNGFEAGVEGPVKIRDHGPNPSYLANFRYSTLEVLSKLGFNFGTGTAVPKYKDFTFLLDIPGTKAGRFKIFGLWGNSYIELGRDIADTTENSYTAKGVATDFGSGLTAIGLSHVYFLNEKSKIKTTISWQQTKSRAVLDSLLERGAVTKPYIRNTEGEDKFSVSSQFSRKVNSRNDYNIGFIADLYSVRYLDSIQSNEYQKFITYADINGTMFLFQGYAQFRHRFSNSFTSVTGLHLQYAGLNKETVIEPRLALEWSFRPNQSLNLGFGMHSQLQPRVVYFYQNYDASSETYKTTNNALGFTRSNHFVAGYNLMVTKDIRFKLESYYQQLYRVPVKASFGEFSMLNAGDNFGMPAEDSLINKGKGRNYGIEVTLEKFLSHGTYFLFTTSIFDSKYMGTDGIWRNTAFNGNYVLNLLGGYELQLGNKTMLTVDLKTVVAGGRRYVPVKIPESMVAREVVWDWSQAYARRYDPYFRADLRFGLKLNGKGFSQEWGIDLQNITGYKSLFMEGFDVTTGDVYKTYQQGFIPMVLYRIRF